MVYKKTHNLARDNVDHPSAKIWDVEDLNNGDESDNEGPPMGSRFPMHPRESPLTMDGLPHECQLVSLNSFWSPS